MKKMIIIISLLASMDAGAQEFYERVGLGYAFPFGGTKIDKNNNALNGTITANGSGYNYQLKSASFSAGMNGVVGLGVTFSPNMGVELGVMSVLVPRTYTANLIDLTLGNNSTVDYTGQRKATHFTYLMPSVLLQTNNAKWNMYMRMGLAVPVYSAIELDESYTYSTGSRNAYQWTINNYFSVGMTGSVGVKVKVARKLSVWAEVNTLYMNIPREKMELQGAAINGQSTPVSQLTFATTVNYIKSGTVGQGAELALGQPYSNIGVMVGVSRTIHYLNKGVKK